MRWKSAMLCDRSEAEYAAAYSEMSPSRKKRVDAQKKADAKKRTLLGEMLLKELLKEENISSAVLAADNGRPYVEGEKFFLSVAHSGDIVVAAVSGGHIGIDVEIIKAVSARLIKRVAVEAELIYISGKAALPDAVGDRDTLIRFFEVWTAKEAYFKRLGTGITDLKAVDTTTLHKMVHITDEYVITIV